MDKKHSAKLQILGYVAAVISASGFSAFVNSWLMMRVGDQCIVAQTSYGLRDLDKFRYIFQKARTAGDEIGLGELIDKEDAAPILQGTSGLIIDRDLIKVSGWYDSSAASTTARRFGSNRTFWRKTQPLVGVVLVRTQMLWLHQKSTVAHVKPVTF